MRGLVLIAACAASLAVGAASAQEEREAGTVVAIHGLELVVDLGDEPAVAAGTVLQAWRRLPDVRGTAAYRSRGQWFQVAELTVVQVGDGLAVARRTAGPQEPIPAELDESGAPADQVHVGDRVRTTGAVGERPVDTRVTFARADLYGEADLLLPPHGEQHLRGWLRGLRSMRGPITVEVHGHFAELGVELPDASRALSAEQDAPFGPVPGEPVVPVEGLHETLARPTLPPRGDEVLVVDGVRGDGTVDAWQYLDPVTLAQRRGHQIAELLTQHLKLPAGAIAVRVVPRGISASYPDAAGYDRPGDQIRILATGMDWSAPDPLPAPAGESRTTPESSDDAPRKRRLLERPPKEVSMRGPAPRTPDKER